MVHEIMLRAFEEYRGVLDPPSAALSEPALLEDREGEGALLALLDGEAAGSARYSVKQDHIYCSRLAVLPSQRRRGIARALLAGVEAIGRDFHLREARLSTREVMQSNLLLYQSCGYNVVSKYRHPRGPGIVVDFCKGL